jgi:hypothetical protein
VVNIAYLGLTTDFFDQVAHYQPAFRQTWPRVVAVVAAEHVLLILKVVVDWVVPDIPDRIRVEQTREEFLIERQHEASTRGVAGGDGGWEEAQHHNHAGGGVIAGGGGGSATPVWGSQAPALGTWAANAAYEDAPLPPACVQTSTPPISGVLAALAAPPPGWTDGADLGKQPSCARTPAPSRKASLERSASRAALAPTVSVAPETVQFL